MGHRYRNSWTARFDYNSLKRQNPEKAARLFTKNESEAKARYDYLGKLTALYGEAQIRKSERPRGVAAPWGFPFTGFFRKKVEKDAEKNE